MSRVCTVCTHPDRARLDAAVVGEHGSIRSIAKQAGVSDSALLRHSNNCLPARLVKGKEAQDEAQALDVVKQLRAINGAALEILRNARQRKDDDTALKAIARVEKQIELQARLLQLISDGPTVNILVNPQWVELRAVILTALAPYPEARFALAEVLHAGA